ncbi:methyltransferase type 12 [Lysinibacillus sp. FJAT-14745]|uniref:methyltransferase domain-containing protein n=1 Tax=Lysinibacillus sp. FJAT-14745 TaxID=1704289 RepID=UPI0006ABD597|nr:methyltransferase domain-containing protein [Lysinibacillus sp. FJAT-14745]KOP72420.1 methyltransferase type 12 [Lysinibacillus sp. FJAT-14745]
MQLTIQAKGENVKAISYLLSKNPNNLYERRVKDHLVRLVYHELSETNLVVTIFVTPNALALVQNDNALDISHYINDREFAASSIFLSMIRSALGTALNGKPKEQYIEWVAQAFSFTFEFGPIASAMTNETINELFQPLGYTVNIEALNNDHRARFLTLSADITLQRALQHLFVLIPVLDDYKHYFIDELEVDKLKRYGEGWLDTHPMKEFIYKKALRFSHLYDGNTTPQNVTRSLNTLRYEKIVETIKNLPQKSSIVDLGSGEGKLSSLLAYVKGIDELLAVEPSEAAMKKAIKRFEGLEDAFVTPKPTWGSLFYYDARLQHKDVIVLCEVIEHINEERLPKIMAMLLTQYSPQTLIVTTPNAEYNAVYELDEMRHDDHRFEWTRKQFQEWCHAMNRNEQYELSFTGIGDQHDIYGQPTQMCIYTKKEENV